MMFSSILNIEFALPHLSFRVSVFYSLLSLGKQSQNPWWKAEDPPKMGGLSCSGIRLCLYLCLERTKTFGCHTPVLLGRTTPQSWLVEDHVQLVSFLFATLFFNQEVLPSGKQTSL